MGRQKNFENMTHEERCEYCGDKNDESCPLVENIKGQLVCECCIERAERVGTLFNMGD